MRTALATILVALTVVLAGCPGADGGSEVDVTEEEATGTMDNDAGAEPVNPENGTGGGNGTDDGFAGVTATANGTADQGQDDE